MATWEELGERVEQAASMVSVQPAAQWMRRS